MTDIGKWRCELGQRHDFVKTGSLFHSKAFYITELENASRESYWEVIQHPPSLDVQYDVNSNRLFVVYHSRVCKYCNMNEYLKSERNEFKIIFKDLMSSSTLKIIIRLSNEA